MGVTGLWRLIEPAGKPVPVETLENKVLAVDISIWLHQMVKGYQDAKGAPVANAHLMGLFQRLCKLLYFRIKPVFVFDGGFPELKRETIAKRQDSKSKYNSESERLKRELSLLLSKKTAVKSLLGHISPKKTNNVDNTDDIFKLPALPEKEEDSESESEEETSSGSIVDLHSVNIESDNFKSLPVKEKYDLLVELKETRKMNSWGKLHELPKKSDNFSDFQLQRLLKRRKVQECLEETEKEMGDTGMSLNELESLLNEEGIDTKIESLPTRRIAANNTTRYLLINDVKKALAEAKQKELEKQAGSSKEEENSSIKDDTAPKKDELEEDLEKAIKMSLECCDESDTSVNVSKTDDSWTSLATESDYSDSEDEDGYEQPDMTSAKAYIIQYSDFSNKYIDNVTNKLIKQNTKTKTKVPNVDKIIDDLNKEKSVIVDNINLSSDEENTDQIRDDHNESIIELNSSEITSDTNMNSFQASIICVEKGESKAICLDTSSDDASNIMPTSDCESLKNIEAVKESRTEKVSELKCDNIGRKEVLETTTDIVKPRKKSTSESSGSDSDDFEEVPENQPETIAITLNVGEAPEDDIFADIFTDSKNTVCMKNEASDIYKNPVPGHSRDEIRSTTKHETKNVDVIPNREAPKGTNIKIVDVTANNILNEPVNAPESVVQVNKDEAAVKLETDLQNQNTHNKQNEVGVTNVDDNKVLDPGEGTSRQNVKEIPRPISEPITTEKLNNMVEELHTEEQHLLQEKGRLDRIGRNITEQMTKEAQELLQIFGIPYIIAPMEAEAQCAFLESVKLTDGTITDDSDIWLFGGRTVYKNFFNQKKHVLQFLSERIERSFNLTREQLILLALLVGSDYTTGVTGVGPVTALEILASFPFNKKKLINETTKQADYAQVVAGLQDFKQWVRTGKRTDNITLKKKLKNVNLSDEFPSVRVVQAYMDPNVEKSKEKFTWGELDITILRDYAKAKFGWSQNKLDEIIKPVLKRIQDRKIQRSVQDYFKRKINFESFEDQMSKRVKAAVHKMGPEGHLECQNNPEEKNNKVRKKKLETKSAENETAGPSKPKKRKSSDEKVLKNHGVKVISQIEESGKTTIEINIPKSDRVQEMIPQREKDLQNILQNKLKAIEIFRKTKIDKKRKPMKRKANLPKEKAELSESSDSN